MLTLSDADVAHITDVTNTRGAAFTQQGLGADPYSFLSCEVVSGNALQIDVTRSRTGSTFSDKEHTNDTSPSDDLINSVLQAIERRLELKPNA